MENPNEPFVPPIVTVRGMRVVLDADAAVLYQVPLEELRRRVRRESRRFPEDFMVCLSPAEADRLAARCGGEAPRFAFLPEGIAMLAAVLDSGLAVNGNVNMTRAFVMLDRLACAGLPAPTICPN
ncbi:MAG: ORF6N domain-containing protein [Elusimicrobia bacterium]|nr:ORF6N domain-containing protein [Elusimicrobiota bacterium]